jgi:Flp pilus assembly protein TadG
MNSQNSETTMSNQGEPAGKRRERGQAVVEAALTLVILLMLLGGILDLGRAFFTYVALQNAVGEGAYYAAGFPHRVTSASNASSADPNNIIFRTRNESPSGAINWSRCNNCITVTYSASPITVGSIVTVTVRYPFDLIGPLPAILGRTRQMTLTARASQPVLNTAP